ncbi:GGDEF domain-containing protein [Saccharopolyspora rhizosphaerae]|uniref:GGDEF domain-containing protein n=1 Tax=Saccharopolyspora rhizosphaerae TaxID=2492662 RepID=A0A3R8QCN4_9PSEU|nr:GGDEF domain-containing protein [Saccharopolyspora rhizosphaerae]RRO18004.1 GGDEF domain-containing protein [Saccharopolyspora rhizosphaerae]
MSGLVAVGALALCAVLAVQLVVAHRERRDLERRLAAAERAAHTDPLTGLANRAGLQRSLDQQRASARPGDHVAMILLDLDGLKQTNDVYGHEFGDSVLVAVARRIHEKAGHAACAARLGGDEFVVLLGADFCSGEATRDAEALADELCAGISSTEVTAEMPIKCTASAGVAVLPVHRMHQLVTAADKAMYRVKSARAGTQRYQPLADVSDRIPRHRTALVALEGGASQEAQA